MEKENKIVRIKITLLSLILVFLFQSLCFAGFIKIYDIWITPGYPADIDSITITVFGGANSPGLVTSALFNPTDFTLDVYIDAGGNYTGINFWTHNEPIGTLPPDDYSITVRAYDFDDNTLQDECTIDFAVTPEPTTLLFFGGGILAIRTFSKKK
ncbi:MAG: hypothetical protein WCZ89_07935 [Phycisphaerae bacterium]